MSEPLRVLDHQHSWLNQWLKRWLRQTAVDRADDHFVRMIKCKKELCFDLSRAFLTMLIKGRQINGYQRKSIETAYLDALANRPESFAVISKNQLADMD